jgi:diguanylate cyclase
MKDRPTKISPRTLQDTVNAANVETTAAVLIGNWIFTRDPKQRLRIRRSLLATLIYAVCTALLFYTVSVGFTRFDHAVMLALWMCGCGLLAYLLIRTDLNRRWFADPSLTLPQIIGAQISCAGAYAITGPVHTGTLPLMAMILVFGMFNLRARDTRNVSLLAVGLIGAVILYKARTDPALYIPQAEWIYFLMAAVCMPTISLLALQLRAIRERLLDQRNEMTERNAALDEALTRIEHMAAHDALTGLVNRRRMLEALREQQKLHARGGQRFCVVMIDLDLFKRINDAYGHSIGDEALRVFAREARAAMRVTDVLARWGGEEFLFLLTNTPPAEAENALSRLRKALVAARVSAATGDLHVTFSAGVVEYQLGESIDTVIDRADRALYTAKEQGRDCTIVMERMAA